MNPNEKSERENQMPKKQMAALDIKALPMIHRVRNARLEKDMADTPWCGADVLNPNVTIIDYEVTCPACLRIIQDRNSTKERVCRHFAGSVKGKTLCGQWFSHKRAAEEAKTLRETTCSDCLDAAEAILVDLIHNGAHLTAEEQWKIFDGGITALRDISETLKELANLWKDEFTVERATDAAERQPESPAAIDD